MLTLLALLSVAMGNVRYDDWELTLDVSVMKERRKSHAQTID